MNWVRAFRDHVHLPFEWRLAGYELVDDQENYVSRVVDLLCEEESGKVRYLLGEIGGVMGIAGKKVLIPAAILTPTGSGQVVVTAALENIQDSPSIGDVENPSRDEESAIFSHFGLKPYWYSIEAGSTGGEGKQPEADNSKEGAEDNDEGTTES